LSEPKWRDLGPLESFTARPLQQVVVDGVPLAVSYTGGVFGAVSGVCNHVGGPLGEGRLDGEYIVCPWHQWKFHCRNGQGEPGFEADRVPCHEVRAEGGRLLVDPRGTRRRTLRIRWRVPSSASPDRCASPASPRR
jgi:nitrite reductase/ring-hydroxylating ferredoxin subunit